VERAYKQAKKRLRGLITGCLPPLPPSPNKPLKCARSLGGNSGQD